MEPFLAGAQTIAADCAIHGEHTVKMIHLVLDQFRKRAGRPDLAD